MGKKGFKCVGFDREIVSANDFLASSVTNRPDPIDNAIPGNQTSSAAADIPQDDMVLQSTVGCSNEVPFLPQQRQLPRVKICH